MIRRRRLHESYGKPNKSEEFMQELVDIMTNNVDYNQNEKLYPLDPTFNGGESWDGFINFTDGFADYKAVWIPDVDQSYGPQFSGEVPADVKKTYDWLTDFNRIEKEFFEENLDEINDEIPERAKKFDSAEEAWDWFINYDPDEESDQYDLFGGTSKSGDQANLDRFYEKLREEVWEWDDGYYNESEAFVGVGFRLDDGEDGEPNTCSVWSYINDDLSYGRSRGDHYVYENTFEWTDFDELKRKLDVETKKAATSIGCEA